MFLPPTLFSPNKQTITPTIFFTNQISKKNIWNSCCIQNSILMRGWQNYAINLVIMMAFWGQTRTGQKNTSGLAVLSCRLLKKPSLEFNFLCIFAVKVHIFSEGRKNLWSSQNLWTLPHKDGKYCQILKDSCSMSSSTSYLNRLQSKNFPSNQLCISSTSRLIYVQNFT